jgi:hypothetical protein
VLLLSIGAMPNMSRSECSRLLLGGWLGLDVTWAGVTLGGDTGDWLDLLFLEVFVGGLFPLAGHSGWEWAAQLTDSEEEN